MLVVLAGCEATPMGWRPGPYVRPGLVMIPADQAHLYGGSAGEHGSDRLPAPQGWSAADVRTVETESEVSALQFNRYADPANPSELMHEAHIVYRRERLPRWKLSSPPAGQQILVGPRLTDGRGEIRPLASQELDNFLRDQRLSQRQQQELLGRLGESLQRLAEQQRALAQQVARSANGAAPDAAAGAPASSPEPEPERP